MERSETLTAGVDQDHHQDRLSELPDHLIHEILSWLDDTKLAVRTSTLSKRWTRLWPYVPSINLIADPVIQSKYFKELIIDYMKDYCQTSYVRALRIHHPRGQIRLPLYHTIQDFCVSHCVEELDLSLTCEDFEELPHTTLFRYPSLRTLKLKCNNSRYGVEFSFISTSMTLITTLHLVFVQPSADNDGFLDNLSSFVNLEKLLLQNVVLKAPTLNISSPRLVDLALMDIYYDYESYHNTSKLVIVSPKLTAFTFQAQVNRRENPCTKVPDVLCMDRCPFLEQVYVNVIYDRRLYGPAGKNIIIPKLISFFRGFSQAKSISLPSKLIEFLSLYDLVEDKAPPFTNLKRLTVVNDDYKIQSLPQQVSQLLLAQSPNAELIFKDNATSF